MPPPQTFVRGGPGRGGAAAAPAGGKTRGGFAGKGLGKGRGTKRHRKILKDTIQGITKPAIRRLARRGGVKRISAMIYTDARAALKAYLENVIQKAVLYVEHAGRKTVTIHDVIFALRGIGRPIYGFDPETIKIGKY
ncbi:hypothetical protein N3K66_002144 [Trichothecium roseum]|uniref:Uncharacterized protein n=1 Tax=Trichothecium roseum TaxID=47278 RepID=A0ACC0V8Q8_9HYPO|nr:hypothetical protein N3K66_002144 [Trichothecium roseum]